MHFVLGTMAEEGLDAIVYPTIRQTPPRIDSNDPWRVTPS